MTVEEKIVDVQPLSKEAFSPCGDVVSRPKISPSVEMDILKYWDSLATLEQVDGEVSIGYLEVYRRPFLLDKLERHVKTWEALIPLEGLSVFPVAPPTEGTPEPETIKAFILDGSAVPIMKRGTWHFAPYPITETATFLVVFRKGTPEEDLELFDLGRLGLHVKFRL